MPVNDDDKVPSKHSIKDGEQSAPSRSGNSLNRAVAKALTSSLTLVFACMLLALVWGLGAHIISQLFVWSWNFFGF